MSSRLCLVYPARRLDTDWTLTKLETPKILISLALPRGLHRVNNINDLAKSGTANHSMRSLGFLPQLSHPNSVYEGDLELNISSAMAALFLLAWLRLAASKSDQIRGCKAYSIVESFCTSSRHRGLILMVAIH